MYLMSYLARAKWLAPLEISWCLKVCTAWIHRFWDDFEEVSDGYSSKSSLDSNVHSFNI